MIRQDYSSPFGVAGAALQSRPVACFFLRIALSGLRRVVTMCQFMSVSFCVAEAVLHSTLETFIYTLHFPSPLHTPHSTLYIPHCTHCTLHLHSTLYNLHSALYTPHFTFHTPHFCTLHSTLYTPHSTRHALHTPHSTLSIAHFRL